VELNAFLTVRTFSTNSECVEALRNDGRQIWAYHYSTKTVSLQEKEMQIPEKLAIVFGAEAEKCSNEILSIADRQVYIPLCGFTESLSLSIAAAVVMQQLLCMCPDARGDLSEEDKLNLRKEWYERLGAKSERRKKEYLAFVDNPPPPLEDLRRPEENKKSGYVKKKLQERIHSKEKELEKEQKKAKIH